MEQAIAERIRQAELARTRRLLMGATVAGGAGTFVYLALMAASVGTSVPELLGGLLLALSLLALHLLARSGHVQLAAVALLSGGFGVAVGITWLMSLGVVQTVTLVLLVVLAGLVAGARGAVVLSTLSVGCVLVYAATHSDQRIEALALAGALGALGAFLARDARETRASRVRLAWVSTERDDQELMLADLVRNTHDGILSVDTAGMVQSINPAVCEMTGYSEDELVGRPFWTLAMLDAQDLRPLRAAFARVCRGERLGAGVVRIRHASGHAMQVDMYARLGQRIDGSYAIIATVRDVTEQVQAELTRADLERRLHNERRLDALGRLAAGVAHDFNNMLTVIMSTVEVLRSDPVLKGRAELDELWDASRRSAELTGQLLALGRRQSTHEEAVNLNDLVRELEAMLRRVLPSNVELRIDLDPDLGAIAADSGELAQVLTNLVQNGADAMPDGGVLEITTRNVDLEGEPTSDDRVLDDCVALRVRDTGLGIDEDDLDNVFEPFYTTKGRQGTGLGLATVYGIVQQSGGLIHVNSEIGTGTVFEILLPRVGVLRPVPEAPPPNWPLTGRETILVVEDQRNVQRAVYRSLVALGYEVRLADMRRRTPATRCRTELGPRVE